MSKTCVHRDCENTDNVEEMWIPITQLTGRKVHCIVHVCPTCKTELEDKPINYTHWRVGNLHFVEEMW